MIKIEGKPEDLARYIGELYRQRGNDKLTVQNLLNQETEAHAETAKRLQDEIRTLKQDIETWRGVAKDDEQQKEKLKEEILRFSETVKMDRSTASIAIETLKAERDRYKHGHEEAVKAVQEKAKKNTSFYAQLLNLKAEVAALRKKLQEAKDDNARIRAKLIEDEEALKAEAAALRTHAGYWRALKARQPASTYPFMLCFCYDGTASFRNLADAPINGFTSFEGAVTAATGYKPEEV